MKRYGCILICLCLLMLFSACAVKSNDRGPADAFDPPDFSPSAAPSDYLQPGDLSGSDSYANRYVWSRGFLIAAYDQIIAVLELHGVGSKRAA